MESRTTAAATVLLRLVLSSRQCQSLPSCADMLACLAGAGQLLDPQLLYLLWVLSQVPASAHHSVGGFKDRCSSVFPCGLKFSLKVLDFSDFRLVPVNFSSFLLVFLPYGNSGTTSRLEKNSLPQSSSPAPTNWARSNFYSKSLTCHHTLWFSLPDGTNHDWHTCYPLNEGKAVSFWRRMLVHCQVFLVNLSPSLFQRDMQPVEIGTEKNILAKYVIARYYSIANLMK